MKRFLAVLFLAFMLNGCDDGDLISEEIDFSDVTTQRCSTGSDILYKLKDRDALILQITNLLGITPTAPSPAGTPLVVPINNTTNRLLYRVYNGEPVAANICATIQPPTPAIIEEWYALSGNMEITSTVLKTANTAEGFEGGEKITGLRHAIVVRNVTYQTPSNQIIDPTVEFGYFDSTFAAPELALGNGPSICPSTLIYKNTSNTTFAILGIDPALLSTTNLNTPKTGLITATQNRVIYNRYAVGTDLNAPSFDYCSGIDSLTPTEIWFGDAGVDGVSGIIEVTTTQIGTSFVHSIRLKNVTMTRVDGAFSFKIADDFLYGELTQ